MAKTWYPIIDYSICKECGTCVEKCAHGVFDPEKAPCPVVVNPGACIDHCHGCGSLCPAGAITYVGDDTGWTPPHASGTADVPVCCCAGDNGAKKQVLVEYLYLDLNTCDRCIGTDGVLDEVVAALTPALELAGYSVVYRKTEMATAQLAIQHRFLSSPTIRVNGQDICASVAENSCGCCSDISGTDVSCRVFEYEGAAFEVPPAKMLAEAILKNVFGASCGCGGGEYSLPENLRQFFEGKNHARCACGGGC